MFGRASATYPGASATYTGASATYWGSNENTAKLSPAEAEAWAELGNKVNPELEKLFQQKEKVMDSLSKLELDDDVEGIEEAKDQLNVVEEAIAKICCEKNKKTVEEYLGNHDDPIEGGN